MIIDENVFPSSIRPQRCSHISVKSGAAFSIYLKTTVLFYGGFIFWVQIVLQFQRKQHKIHQSEPNYIAISGRNSTRILDRYQLNWWGSSAGWAELHMYKTQIESWLSYTITYMYMYTYIYMIPDRTWNKSTGLKSWWVDIFSQSLGYSLSLHHSNTHQ